MDDLFHNHSEPDLGGTGKPKVSVVIPTYNRIEYLERALASVMAQTFRDFEIIVVQNGRTRESQKVVEKFLGRGITVRYFYLPAANAVHARNLGAQQAEGEFIAFLDDDDEWFADKLEKQVAYFDAHPGTGLVACHVNVVKNGKPMPDPRAVFPEERVSFFHFIEKGCVIYSLSCVMISKECFIRTGPMNPEYRIANDYDYYFRISNRYPVCIIREPLLLYRRHEGNAIGNLKKTISENRIVLMDLKKRCRENWTGREIGYAIERQKDFYARATYSEASQLMEEKSYLKAVKRFYSALANDPMIGTKVSWGRFNAAFYKILRPYMALAYCALLAVKEWISGSKPVRTQ